MGAFSSAFSPAAFAVAAVAPPPPPPPPPKFIRLALKLLDQQGVEQPAANLAGLSGCVFNESRRHLLTAPAVTFQGKGTDAQGLLEINASALSVPVGGWAYLVYGTDDADPAADSSGWHGPAQVVS